MLCLGLLRAMLIHHGEHDARIPASVMQCTFVPKRVERRLVSSGIIGTGGSQGNRGRQK